MIENYEQQMLTDSNADVKECYAIFDKLERLNYLSMFVMMVMGLHGFKRLHECKVKKIACLKLKFAKMAQKESSTVIDFLVSMVTYNPISLKDHLEKMTAELKETLPKIAEHNKKYIDMQGYPCELLSCLYCLVEKMAYKFEKYHKRFTAVDWLGHDIYVLDDRLHDKYKGHTHDKHRD